MAAAPRRRKPAPPPSRLQRVRDTLETPRAIVAAVTALWIAGSLTCGSVYSWTQTAWRHYTGAELAHEHDPRLEATEKLATETRALTAQVAERTNASEQRLKKAETTLDEIRQLKALEQERTQAVEQAQRAACLRGDINADACDRLGYPRPLK